MKGFLLSFIMLAAGPASTIDRTLAAAHLDHRTQLLDKFAEATVDNSVAGAAFAVVRRFKDGQARSGVPGDGYYSYDDGKLRLILIPHEKSAGAGAPRYTVAIIGGRRIPTRSFVGSNAFGVTRTVSVIRMEDDGIAFLSSPEGEVNPYSSGTLQSYGIKEKRDTYWVEFQLPGPAAKAMALDSEFVIQGIIAPLSNGKVAECDGDFIEATINSPTQLYGEKCWVGAKVNRIIFRRKSTGEVLKEWPTQ